MASVNRVILLGHLGKDPEVRYTPGGDPVANFSLATTHRWREKDGAEVQEKTSWHRIVAWKRLAEIAGEYLKKGSPVYVEGRIDVREYTDKEGVKRQSHDIIVERLQLLGKRPEGERSEPSTAKGSSKSPSQETFDEDVPF